MDGETLLGDRASAAYQITERAVSVDRGERRKIEAVLYVMADKFLDSIEKEKFKEAIQMTELGQMLVNEGIEKGIEKGKLQIAQNLIGLLDERTIAERTELPLKTVLELKEKKYPFQPSK